MRSQFSNRSLFSEPETPANVSIESTQDNTPMTPSDEQQDLEIKTVFKVTKVNKKTGSFKVLSNHRKMITNCPHFATKEHYCKGRCKSCYYKDGNTKLSTECEHTDRMHYAKGMCHSCYSCVNKRKNRQIKRKRIDQL